MSPQTKIISVVAAAEKKQIACAAGNLAQPAARGTQQVSSNISDVRRGAAEIGMGLSRVPSVAECLGGGLCLKPVGFPDTIRAASR